MSIMENLNIGHTVLLRNGSEQKVEFVAYMPDDLHIDYEYVVKLTGYEAAAYTDQGLWCHEEESPNDIVTIVNHGNDCFKSIQ